jgi:hypothetical protein
MPQPLKVGGAELSVISGTTEQASLLPFRLL